MKNNEQWKSQGDCEKCRRKNYCSKPCTIRKRKELSMLSKLIARRMLKGSDE